MKDSSKKLLIYGGVAVGAYYFVLKPLLIKLGIVESPQQAAQREQQTQNIQEYITSSTTTQQPTKSVGEWQIIANQIYQDLKFSSIADNTSDAVAQITRVKNNADFGFLYQTFGTRQKYFFGLPYGGLMDLQQFVTASLSSGDIAVINNNYRRKGIKYQF